MVLWAQTGEGFSTVCGINDGCSEKFLDADVLVDFGNQNETTCKKCLTKFLELLTKHDTEVAALSHST